MRLLLVEDEKRMAEALAAILRKENYEVDIMNDGDEGLYAAQSEAYDIMILDVMLPGMSGFEIAKQLRRDGIKTPILMLTAKGELDDKVEGLDSGADDYLTKPFMTKELLARLRALERRYSGVNNDNTLSFGGNHYGLGLSIAKSIVDIHKGEITVDCKDGKVIFEVSIKTV